MTNEQRKRIHDITYSTDDRMELAERIVALEDKRDKLREFVQAVTEVAYKGQMLCNECRFSHGCYNGGKKEHEGRGCQWWLWARELGIEVK